MNKSLRSLLGMALSGLVAVAQGAATESPLQPNMIFILADDLGYGDLGCYGQTRIQTPHLDRMAGEGLRFTRFYAGSTVCAPSRSVLMTGQHLGHTRVRGNAGPENSGAQRLQAEDVTVAEMLKQAGYATGLIGKWGLGMPGDEGVPNRQGFDYFFGFLSQHRAHNHYPDYLWRNDQKVPLPNEVVPVGVHGGGYATNRVAYAGDLFAQEALDFVQRHRRHPFFLYLALTVPHANNERTRVLKDGQEVPGYGSYAQLDWSDSDKGQAAMITRMDAQIGRLLAQLEQFGIQDNTLVFFSSDNGPHREGGNDPAFFKASGPLRGMKRDLYEGGIRVPGIAHWPGTIAPGAVSDHVAYFGDLMATFAELAGTTPPPNIDSLSLVPTLLGHPELQRQHPYLYWEFYEGGFSQAVLLNDRWKGIRLRSAPIQLYDLHADPAEQHDLASDLPERIGEITALMKSARHDNAFWKAPSP